MEPVQGMREQTRAPSRAARRITVTDLAREAGVSRSTVSLVLRNSPLVKPRDRAPGRGGHRPPRLHLQPQRRQSAPQNQRNGGRGHPRPDQPVLRGAGGRPGGRATGRGLRLAHGQHRRRSGASAAGHGDHARAWRGRFPSVPGHGYRDRSGRGDDQVERPRDPGHAMAAGHSTGCGRSRLCPWRAPGGRTVAHARPSAHRVSRRPQRRRRYRRARPRLSGRARRRRYRGRPRADRAGARSTRGGGVDALRRVLALDKPPTAALCFSDVVAFGVLDALGRSGSSRGSGLQRHRLRRHRQRPPHAAASHHCRNPSA